MSREYYKRWLTNGYEEDLSIDKPSYSQSEIKEMPKIIPQKSKPIIERKPNRVHTTSVEEKYIEKDGFAVIVDDDGELITDMKLLRQLRGLRIKLMKENNCQAYNIIGNKGLVSLATYKPETKEEFISLKGLGESAYSSFCKAFVYEIKEYNRFGHSE